MVGCGTQTRKTRPMPNKRKLWATSFPAIPGDQRTKHPSEPAVYRWLKEYAALWDQGKLPSPMVTIWVDERDGQGWCTYERIDLREVKQ